MKIIDSKYWLLIPIGIIWSIIAAVLLREIIDINPDTNFKTALIAWVVVLSLTLFLSFIGIEIVLHRIFSKQFIIEKLGGEFGITLGITLLGSGLLLILHLILPFIIIAGFQGSLMFYFFTGNFHNKYPTLQDDNFAIYLNHFLGFNMGIYIYWLIESWLNSNTIYYLFAVFPVYIFSFYVTFLLAELKQHRKLINGVVVLLLLALLVDTFLIN